MSFFKIYFFIFIEMTTNVDSPINNKALTKLIKAIVKHELAIATDPLRHLKKMSNGSLVINDSDYDDVMAEIKDENKTYKQREIEADAKSEEQDSKEWLEHGTINGFDNYHDYFANKTYIEETKNNFKVIANWFATALTENVIPIDRLTLKTEFSKRDAEYKNKFEAAENFAQPFIDDVYAAYNLH
jgi:hypothetical protein